MGFLAKWEDTEGPAPACLCECLRLCRGLSFLVPNTVAELPGGEGSYLVLVGDVSPLVLSPRRTPNSAAPLPMRSGEVDEAHEGLLVEVFGPAVRWGSADIILDDGCGEARTYIRDTVGFARPPVERGEKWSVVGIVSQYAAGRPFVGSYRLLPRYAWDLSNGPLFLPVTGG